MPKRALIVIDVQNEYFDGALPISDPPPRRVSRTSGGRWTPPRRAGVPVIVVRHGATDPDARDLPRGLARMGAASGDRAAPARPPDREDAARLVHGHAARRRPRRRRHRHGRDHRLHDAHVRRHDRAPGRPPRSGRRDPQRRHRHALAREQRRQRRRRGAAPGDARRAGPVLRRRALDRRLARPDRPLRSPTREAGGPARRLRRKIGHGPGRSRRRQSFESGAPMPDATDQPILLCYDGSTTPSARDRVAGSLFAGRRADRAVGVGALLRALRIPRVDDSLVQEATEALAADGCERAP